MSGAAQGAGRGVRLAWLCGLALGVVAPTGCTDSSSGGKSLTPCRQARRALCASACTCGSDVSCVWFPVDRSEMSPLRTNFQDQMTCEFLSNLQCDQYERSGLQRDWTQCERDLEGFVCSGTGRERGVEIPRSCELPGDADDPLDELGIGTPDPTADPNNMSPCFLARTQVCDQACACGTSDCGWYAPVRAASQDREACLIMAEGQCESFEGRGGERDWAACSADLAAAECTGEGDQAGLALPVSCGLPPFEDVPEGEQ